MVDNRVPIIGISRHRLATDGEGVTTLVAFHSCPLSCRYCLNPQSLSEPDRFRRYSPEELYEKVRIDELYYIATGGGVTFGGGEPALRPEFISRFRDLCGPQWKINMETSLCVPQESIERLLPVVDSFIIDIKDMNPEIYRAYTGRDNAPVLQALDCIADADRQNDCLIRLPLIPEFNTEADRRASRDLLTALGYTRFDTFSYIVKHR
ncbi:MAG: radical SAM protein [Muribaculaceae bacterium]|nr:radical SAM protein [Muribaculaceae bacterium]